MFLGLRKLVSGDSVSITVFVVKLAMFLILGRATSEIGACRPSWWFTQSIYHCMSFVDAAVCVEFLYPDSLYKHLVRLLCVFAVRVVPGLIQLILAFSVLMCIFAVCVAMCVSFLALAQFSSEIGACGLSWRYTQFSYFGCFWWMLLCGFVLERWQLILVVGVTPYALLSVFGASLLARLHRILGPVVCVVVRLDLYCILLWVAVGSAVYFGSWTLWMYTESLKSAPDSAYTATCLSHKRTSVAFVCTFT